MSISIVLGLRKDVEQLFSYPNSPTLGWTLEETIAHWFNLTLQRDGFAAQGATCEVSIRSGSVSLKIDGSAALLKAMAGYKKRVPIFLRNGLNALTKIVPKIRKDGVWDASPDPAPYHPWRFFLPHGMAMLNQKALLFFHYPPIRLLDTNQDYLDDPVPVRCEELLTANGVSSDDLPLFNTVMDATPIAAEDDQGSKKGPDGKPVVNPVWGAIPIQYFHSYQKAQVRLLLNPSLVDSRYTVPIVVYGDHPRQTFNAIYGTSLTTGGTATVEILPGRKTAVLSSTHPYVFYGMAQGFDKIGSGKLVSPGPATSQMISDLAVARWLKALSDNPAQDPAAVWKDSMTFWSAAAQKDYVSALVTHQGSLSYSDRKTLAFTFLKPIGTSASPPVQGKTTTMKKATAATTGRVHAKSATARATKTSKQKLQAIGDSGKAVDWWFIYKISKEAVGSGPKATGTEYVYFDSDMAKSRSAGLVLSKNRIDKGGALSGTLAQIFGPEAKANRNLGWYCYNDEDHKDSRGAGSGPSDRGHCKGTLAFDLASNTAFWLIHSVPLFPLTARFEYPETGMKMAQTMLCISLKDADTARHIAALMYAAHGPNVHLASDLLPKSSLHPHGFAASALPVTDVPGKLDKDDPRLQLMSDLNGSMASKPKPYSGRVPFHSRGHNKFLAIAKNKAWGNKDDDTAVRDFYNDLVEPTLNEDIEVETWENAGNNIPPRRKKGQTHDVLNMAGVDLNPLKIPYAWSEKVDHAKLAISEPSNPPGSARWVCVGDINFTDAQERRGGGTVAFKCEPLWRSLMQVLDAKSPVPSRKASASGSTTKKKSTSGSKSVSSPSSSKKSASPKNGSKKVSSRNAAKKKAAPRKK